MPEKILQKQDLLDILDGCTVLGTGGGGELSEGLMYIDYAFDQGKTFKLISINDAPQDAYVCTPYLLGALVEPSDTNDTPNLPILNAFERLKGYTKQNFYGTICCELGGSNSAISFMLAAMFDGYIIDADPAGRAVPEITHSTFYLNNLPAWPIVSANEHGEVYICEHIADDLRAETVMRSLSQISGNTMSVIDHAMPIKDIKHGVIEGTISLAMSIGKFLRTYPGNNINKLNALADTYHGMMVFRGEVLSLTFSEQDGFTVGTVVLTGEHEFAGSEYRIQVKNENMSGLLNGTLHTCIPDLICCFDEANMRPITNPNYSVGMRVAVLLLPAPEAFLSAEGLSIFGPQYAGFNTEFVSLLDKRGR